MSKLIEPELFMKEVIDGEVVEVFQIRVFEIIHYQLKNLHLEEHKRPALLVSLITKINGSSIDIDYVLYCMKIEAYSFVNQCVEQMTKNQIF